MSGPDPFDDHQFKDCDGTPVYIGDEVICTLQGQNEAGKVVDAETRHGEGWVAVQFAFGLPWWVKASEVGVVPF